MENEELEVRKVACHTCGKLFEVVVPKDYMTGDIFFCEGCSGIKIFEFKVDGLPPIKDGANSMWNKPEMAERIRALRVGAKAALNGSVLKNDITLAVEIECMGDCGDLDNFVAGICDCLQIANTKPQFIHPSLRNDPSIDPATVCFIEDDSKIMRIESSINKKASKNGYLIELYDEK